MPSRAADAAAAAVVAAEMTTVVAAAAVTVDAAVVVVVAAAGKTEGNDHARWRVAMEKEPGESEYDLATIAAVVVAAAVDNPQTNPSVGTSWTSG